LVCGFEVVVIGRGIMLNEKDGRKRDQKLIQVYERIPILVKHIKHPRKNHIKLKEIGESNLLRLK